MLVVDPGRVSRRDTVAADTLEASPGLAGRDRDSIGVAPVIEAIERDSLDLPHGAPKPADTPETPSLSELGYAGTEDTTGFRVELGTRMDVTNESYYEDAFVDTTFLGRQLVDTPEHRSSGVISAILAGTRQARSTQYRLHGDAAIGNLLQRGSLALAWRSAIGLDGSWFLDPRAEYRRDRTLGRHLEEWRASLGTRLRRDLGEGFTHAELGVRGDLLRTDGDATFLLDRQIGSASLAVDHLGLLGDEWRLAYRISGRAFPDSGERDHLEHFWEGRRKIALDGGRWMALEATGTRRLTLSPVPSSRDNFWNGEATLEARVGIANDWALGVRADGELTHYDVEDSTLFFDYQVLRGQMALRWERGVRWSLSAGPRLETLTARLNPGEGYQEAGGVLELELLGSRSWWSLTPAAGWRDYDEVPAAGAGTPALHSSFSFYEINGIADQVLYGRLRLRALVAVRWERHLDPAQDARSLFASSELLWTLR